MQNYNTQGAPQNAQEKVHSQMLKTKGKTYFFDVKKASNGSNYLSIAESYTKPTGEKVINRLIVFKDNMAEFASALEGCKSFLQ